jgi:hypothetical protein
MGEACSAHEDHEKWVQNFEWKARREKTIPIPSSKREVNIKSDINERGLKGVVWNYVVQEGNLKQAFMNMVMISEFHKMP